MVRQRSDCLRGDLMRLCDSGCAIGCKVVVLLSFCFSIGLTFAEEAPQPPAVGEPLEKYGDPPMHIFRLGVSQQMVSSFGAFTSYQVNVDADGNNITGDAANEPSITVNPTNHNQMAIGWRQFDSVVSNFRQA